MRRKPSKLTSEAQVKQAIREVLDRHAPLAYYEMWVPSGYGKRGLDFNVSVVGRALYIEAKRPGEYPTPQQRQTMKACYESGASVFVISGEEGVEALSRWLQRIVDPGVI